MKIILSLSILLLSTSCSNKEDLSLETVPPAPIIELQDITVVEIIKEVIDSSKIEQIIVPVIEVPKVIEVPQIIEVPIEIPVETPVEETPTEEVPAEVVPIEGVPIEEQLNEGENNG